MGIFSAECWSILCWWDHHGRDEKKEVIDCLLSKGSQRRAEVAIVNEYINNGYTWHTCMHVTEQCLSLLLFSLYFMHLHTLLFPWNERGSKSYISYNLHMHSNTIGNFFLPAEFRVNFYVCMFLYLSEGETWTRTSVNPNTSIQI